MRRATWTTELVREIANKVLVVLSTTPPTLFKRGVINGMIATDASLFAIGAWSSFNDEVLSEQLKDIIKIQRDIRYNELYAIQAAITKWTPYYKGVAIDLYTDNQVAAYTLTSGFSHTDELNSLVAQIYRHLNEIESSLIVHYISSERNTLADLISRNKCIDGLSKKLDVLTDMIPMKHVTSSPDSNCILVADNRRLYSVLTSLRCNSFSGVLLCNITWDSPEVGYLAGYGTTTDGYLKVNFIKGVAQVDIYNTNNKSQFNGEVAFTKIQNLFDKIRCPQLFDQKLFNHDKRQWFVKCHKRTSGYEDFS